MDLVPTQVRSTMATLEAEDAQEIVSMAPRSRVGCARSHPTSGSSC